VIIYDLSRIDFLHLLSLSGRRGIVGAWASKNEPIDGLVPPLTQGPCSRALQVARKR
jgi:hypothetical protein